MIQSKTLLFSLVALALAYFYYKSGSTPREGKIVDTLSGQVKGIISVSRDGREYYEYLAIPYAKPPTGDLRFQSPQPIGKWKGVLDASRFGSKCAQHELFSWNFIGAEDCLFINVHVPKLEKKQQGTKGLPVLVYIHGGGFFSMGADDYTAEHFMDEDVVLVSINYRLSVLGFLNTGDVNIRGNMGLKDQLLALKWIKSNVEFFGGDPNQVTIFGESAGASSVHYLMLAEKKTRGLFQKAITMSGTALAPFAYQSPSIIVEQTKTVAARLNCPNGTGKEIVDCLRKIDVGDLFGAVLQNMQDLSELQPHKKGDLLPPTVEAVHDDEAFLTQSPYEILSQGKASRAPWMNGVCANEGLFMALGFYREGTLDIYENNWEDLVTHQFNLASTGPPSETKKAAEKLRKFYFTSKDITMDQKIKKYAQLFGDGNFIAGSNEAASIQRKFSDVYSYVYDRPGGPSMTQMIAEFKWRYPFVVELVIFLAKTFYNEKILGLPPKDYGHSAHAEDLPMFFPMTALFPTSIDGKDKSSKDYKFSKDLVKLWVAFAKDEKSMEFRGTKFLPSSKTGPLSYLKLDEKSEILEDPFANRVDVWRSIHLDKIYSDKN